MTPKERLKHEIKSSGLSRRWWYRNIYLYSQHWRDLRDQKFAKDGKQCKTCGTHHNLQCHHLKYRSIYNVTPDDLEVLCQRCHNKEHKRLKKDRKKRREERQLNRAAELETSLDRQLDQRLHNEL